MEDHLKNKNRLEREWEALCSYQAEPSASCVGRGEQNTKRNRSDAVVACESRQFRQLVLRVRAAKSATCNSRTITVR